MRSLLSILSGLIAGLVIYFVGYLLFNSSYPYPEAIDLNDHDSVQSYINTFDRKAYVFKLITNLIVIFTIGFLTSIIDKKFRFQSGIIAILPVLIYFMYRDFTYEYNTTYVILNTSLCLITGFLSILFGASRNVG